MLVICKAWAYFGTLHFGKRHLGMDISSSLKFWPHGHSSGKLTFHHCGCFGMGTFWQVDFSGQGHGDILAWGQCTIGIFWLRYFNEVDALTYEHISECYFVWCQNLPVHLLKYPCDELYQAGISMVPWY